MAFPEPLFELVMVIHELLLTAVQAHVEPVVMVELCCPPPAVVVTVVGDTVYEQAAPVCDTLIVVPATIAVPVRVAGSGLAAIDMTTDPVPDPPAGENDSQESPVDAAHVQPVVVVTLIVRVPAVEVRLTEVGETV